MHCGWCGHPEGGWYSFSFVSLLILHLFLHTLGTVNWVALIGLTLCLFGFLQKVTLFWLSNFGFLSCKEQTTSLPIEAPSHVRQHRLLQFW